MSWFAALRRPLQYAILLLCEIFATGAFTLLIMSAANTQASGLGAWLFDNEIAARCLTSAVYVGVLVGAVIFGLHAWQVVGRQKQANR